MKRSLNNFEQISNDKIKVRIQSNASDICISDFVLDAEETWKTPQMKEEGRIK